MDSEAATGEINSTAGGSLAQGGEHEVNEQSNEDGSSASLAQAGGDEESNEVEEESDEGADEAAMEGKRKRGRGRERRGEGEEEGTAKKERKRRSIAREGATPVDRPSRERKRVERFAAMSPRKISVPKTPSFEQGSGQKLKDIPNVSFKLSKRKADENLRALHTLLFGRKSTVHYLKRNILKFSGFVWSQNEEKQRTRVKEKLDKYNKERLLDFCDLFDIHAVKITTKKEEIVLNLLEFLESPCITRDVVLSEKKGKRRGQSKGISGAISSEKSNKKQRTGKKQPTADENGDTEENVSGDAKDETKDGEDDGDSSEESERCKSEDDEEQNEPAPSNNGSAAQQTKKAIAPPSEKSKVTLKKIPSGKDSEDGLDVSSEDEPSSPPESKKHSGKEMNELETMTSAKEKSSRTKSAKSTKSTFTSSARKSDSLDGSDSEPPSDSKNKKVGRKGKAKEKTPSKKEGTSRRKKAKPESEETNKKQGKSKPNQAKKNEPSTEELHSVVSKILKEVDFNTATLADILRRLGAHFNTNLMDRKAEVKHIIEDVIDNMTDEEDAEDEDGAEDNAERDDAKKD
ncbi:DEK domain-containing chromatin-associated protein 1-like [Curcuma longa]|uniref:DEK domain-containing chromatin-associated protein 1-like n=1 Tax=Curcuma longa TaxID=136217 RepID=UPI003D9F9640